jgi:hypothetical protein
MRIVLVEIMLILPNFEWRFVGDMGLCVVGFGVGNAGVGDAGVGVGGVSGGVGCGEGLSGGGVGVGRGGVGDIGFGVGVVSSQCVIFMHVAKVLKVLL